MEDDDAVEDRPFEVQGSIIGLCRTQNWAKAGPGTINAMRKAREILEGHGAKVEEIELPKDFTNILEWHSAVLSGEGRTSFLGQYLTDKEKLHQDMIGHVENRKNISRKAQLAAYDECARLRPVWDGIAQKYDVVLTPSVVDEAPVGLESTGDMVSEIGMSSVPYQDQLTGLLSLSARCGPSYTSLR